MQGGEPFERLRRPGDGVVDRHRTRRRMARQAVAERAAFDDLQGEEDRLAGLLDVEDPHDAGMDDVAGDRGLAPQTQERPGERRSWRRTLSATSRLSERSKAR